MWYNVHVRREGNGLLTTTKENNMDELYPLILGYTLPYGEVYSVVITDEYQSEDEYSKMFELCGYDVKFSVDERADVRRSRDPEGLMKVGDMIKLHDSERRNGILAGKLGLIVDLDKHDNPVVNVDGAVKMFHRTQIGKVIK